VVVLDPDIIRIASQETEKPNEITGQLKGLFSERYP
jgi:hypothetical protein